MPDGADRLSTLKAIPVARTVDGSKRKRGAMRSKKVEKFGAQGMTFECRRSDRARPVRMITHNEKRRPVFVRKPAKDGGEEKKKEKGKKGARA